MVTRAKPPALGRMRLASTSDVPGIMGLLTHSMKLNFRIDDEQDLTYLIENAILSICALDINEDLVGFLSARDYPQIPSVHPDAWEEYIWTKYKTIELNARNTLFLHLLAWNPIYARELVDSMLKSVFMHDPYVMHIGMVKCIIKHQLLVPGQSRTEASFRRIQAIEKGVQPELLPGLYLADRSEVSPRLRIRRAVEEDNDDLVPILDRHSERLREMYGEFYISELIARHPESERVLLVCEWKEVAVGVMCLNTQINFEALEEDFELGPYAGLRKLTHPVNKNKTNSLSDVPSNISKGSQIYNDYALRQLLSERGKGKSADEMKEGLHDDSFMIESPYHLIRTNYQEVIDLLEDEDEIEFDIVNIDTELLRVPKFLSYDTIPAERTYPKKLNNTSQIPASSYDKKTGDQIPKFDTPWPEPRRYIGTSNAFLIEIFAMHQDQDERYGFDMLEATFELFPDKDYCIICVPSYQTPFPLLEHFTLVTPSKARGKFKKDTLYVAHVNSVKGDLKVRPAEANDLRTLSDIVEHAPHVEHMTELFITSLSPSSRILGYVFLSENQPMGMCLVGQLEDGVALRTQFDLEAEPRRTGTDGTILASMVTPTMEPHFRWFMREVLRQSQFSTLFWLCKLFSKGDLSPNRNLMSLAGHMTPVHPRRAVPNISGDKNVDKIYKEMTTPFALWILERPLTSMPKVYVNTGIVVVGASCTGLAFLESLLLGPTSQYITFTNVSLVSEHGIPTVVECLKAADTCVPRDGRYTDRYLKSVPFNFYLDVISTSMVGIDRKKKCIHLKSGGKKHYDELVLTCGQQFQHPQYLSEPLAIVKEVARGKPCDRTLMDSPNYLPDKVALPPDTPSNVMIINSLYEANRYLKKIMVMVTEYKEHSICLSEENPVVVYGSCIEVYSCMAALLELGISPTQIVFVEPFPSEDPVQLRVNCFNNTMVDERVQQKIEAMGIRILRKTYLMSWEQTGMHVESLQLMCRQLQVIDQPCFALFYYGLKAIDFHAFKAINDCGLVYDGGLVVNPAFETNDPFVYGAGTCVKYSRKLYADYCRSHRHYNSEDVGEALAQQFLNRLDPFVMGSEQGNDLLPTCDSSMFRCSLSLSTFGMVTPSRIMSATHSKWQPVMRFESPIMQCATLPGPMYYLKVRKPGRETPMAVHNCMTRTGHTLLTDKNSNYFRLQLNNLHVVTTVTCLSNKPFSSEIMTQLYGKHEAFFNKLLTRFKFKQVDDLYDFFIQPWMSAVYQEPFDELLRAVNEDDIKQIYEMIKLSRFPEGEMKCRQKASSKDEVDKEVFESHTGIDRFVSYGKRNSVVKMAKVYSKVDIPSECGQSKEIRNEAMQFWQKIAGERIVISHLAKYLSRNGVINPHYASPNVDFI